jgi:hypothetical protein
MEDLIWTQLQWIKLMTKWKMLNCHEQIITFLNSFKTIMPLSFRRLFLMSHLIYFHFWFPFLDTTSQLPCISLTLMPQLLCNASCNRDQQGCMPFYMSNNAIQCNISLQMNQCHIFTHLFIYWLQEVSRCNCKSNDCQPLHHFLLT